MSRGEIIALVERLTKNDNCDQLWISFLLQTTVLICFNTRMNGQQLSADALVDDQVPP